MDTTSQHISPAVEGAEFTPEQKERLEKLYADYQAEVQGILNKAMQDINNIQKDADASDAEAARNTINNI